MDEFWKSSKEEFFGQICAGIFRNFCEISREIKKNIFNIFQNFCGRFSKEIIGQFLEENAKPNSPTFDFLKDQLPYRFVKKTEKKLWKFLKKFWSNLEDVLNHFHKKYVENFPKGVSGGLFNVIHGAISVGIKISLF